MTSTDELKAANLPILDDNSMKENSVSNITMEQLVNKYSEEIDKLREVAGGRMADESMLFRYLRGYRYDITQAIEALERSLKWREENKIDEIKEKCASLKQMEFPHGELAMKLGPHIFEAGYQKNGSPLNIDRSGLLDPQGFLDSISFDDMLLYQNYQMEKKLVTPTQLTKEKNQFVCSSRIFDLSGLGFKHLNRAALDNMKKLLAVGQANYPEMIDKIFVVNAPTVFTTLWTFVKPMLNARTCSKVVVLGQHSQEKLHEFIDPRELPVWLGGYNLNDPTAAFDPKEGCVDIYVGARSVLEKKIPLKSGEKGEWDIRITNIDINIGIVFESAKEGKQVLYEKIKTNRSIKGHHVASEDGFLIVTFDNSYSFLTGKSVPSRIGIFFESK